ncbi:hypothetical protein P7C73_g4861, partial [Tremellales sp. Uapishka_1]
MLITILSRLSCNVCCFLYPAYASYKALSISEHSPAGAQSQSSEIERWLMYWSVVGTWTAVEAVCGWVFTWLPFYSLGKCIFFLYLSLPQSSGSSYIYRAHLEPFFNDHEADIDSFLASLKTRFSTALAGGIGWVWETVKSQLNVVGPIQPGSGSGQGGIEPQYPNTIHQPPTLSDPASGAAQALYGYLSRYAGHYMPIAISAVSAAAQQASRSTHVQGYATDPTHASQVQPTHDMPIPQPTPITPVRSHPSDSSLRSRTYLAAQRPSSDHLARPAGTGRSVSAGSSDESVHRLSGYEEIGRDEVENIQAQTQRPGMGEKRRSSWWGWSGGSSTEAKPKAE